mmetsp:Transcript_19806/g.48625  ORF Transcript_19806/g.48625 Transcript_19806/m.48625 type:complete len:220 (-) Transcript_19806:122-781(-)
MMRPLARNVQNLSCTEERLRGDGFVLIGEARGVGWAQEVWPLVLGHLDVLAMRRMKQGKGLRSFEHAQPCVRLPHIHMQLRLCPRRSEEEPLKGRPEFLGKLHEGIVVVEVRWRPEVLRKLRDVILKIPCSQVRDGGALGKVRVVIEARKVLGEGHVLLAALRVDSARHRPVLLLEEVEGPFALPLSPRRPVVHEVSQHHRKALVDVLRLELLRGDVVR